MGTMEQGWLGLMFCCTAMAFVGWDTGGEEKLSGRLSCDLSKVMLASIVSRDHQKCYIVECLITTDGIYAI